MGENNILTFQGEIESLTIGGTEIKGGSFDFSTADAGIANKIMYMMELFSSIFAMKHYSNTEQKGESL